MPRSSKKINHLVALLFAIASAPMTHSATSDKAFKALIGNCIFSGKFGSSMYGAKAMPSLELRLLDVSETRTWEDNSYHKLNWVFLSNEEDGYTCSDTRSKLVELSLELGTQDQERGVTFFHQYGLNFLSYGHYYEGKKINLELQSNCLQLSLSTPMLGDMSSCFARFGYCFGKKQSSSFHLTTVESLSAKYGPGLNQSLRKFLVPKESPTDKDDYSWTIIPKEK